MTRAKRVILAVDGDGPGRALEYELARRIGRAKCWRVRWPELTNDVQTKDANDVLVEGGADALRETIEAAEPLPIRSLYDLEAFREETTALYRGEIKRGVSTGWLAIDPLLKIRPGDLTVISRMAVERENDLVGRAVPQPCPRTWLGDSGLPRSKTRPRST